MKILVADDDPLMLKTLDFRLKREGYDVCLTKNGTEALQKFDEIQPDFVLTDITMPHSTGLQVTASIRRSSKTPIIILSALGQESVILEAFRLGVDDYVVKPFSPNELLVRIKRLTSRT